MAIVAAGVGAGAAGAGVLAGAAGAGSLFLGVLVEYLDRGKNLLIQMSLSVDSDLSSSFFLKESFSGLMC
jgi:hypothetical protein